jgi:hypothetical protein
MAAWLDVCRYTPTLGGTTDWTYSAAVTGYQSPVAAGVVNGRLYKYRAESADLSQWEIGEGAYNTGSNVLARTTVLFNSLGTTAKVSFSTVPQIAVVALKEDMISVEEANSFTASQQQQVRANVYAAPFDAMAYNGMQINGGADVSQEIGTTGATLATTVAKYIADCIQAQYVHGAGTAVITSAQLPAASFPAVLSGYSNAHQLKATTALTAPANGDYALHRWIIEGYRIARLGFGAAGAGAFSYGLQFYSTVSGTAFLKFSNSAYTRCFYQEQTIAAGWNWLTGTVVGDTAGTWQATNSVGLYVEIFASGKAASPAAPGAWGATSTTQTTNSTNLLGTNANQTCATGLIVVPGSEVPNSARAPFIMRPFDQELDLCLRQYEKSYTYATAPGAAVGSGSNGCVFGSAATVGSIIIIGLQKTKRAAPVFGLLSTSSLRTYDGAGTVGKNSYNNTGTGWQNGGTPSASGISSLDKYFAAFLGGTSCNFIACDYVVDVRL